LNITRASEKSKAAFMNAMLYAQGCFRMGTIDASKRIIKALARLEGVSFPTRIYLHHPDKPEACLFLWAQG